jgi:hypothetical protein
VLDVVNKGMRRLKAGSQERLVKADTDHQNGVVEQGDGEGGDQGHRNTYKDTNTDYRTRQASRAHHTKEEPHMSGGG